MPSFSCTRHMTHSSPKLRMDPERMSSARWMRLKTHLRLCTPSSKTNVKNHTSGMMKHQSLQPRVTDTKHHLSFKVNQGNTDDCVLTDPDKALMAETVKTHAKLSNELFQKSTIGQKREFLNEECATCMKSLPAQCEVDKANVIQGEDGQCHTVLEI